MRAGWEVKPLGNLAELQGRIGWKGLTAKEYTKEGPLFLSVHGLNYGDVVDFRDAFHISQERYDESPEIMLQENDVLICKDGAGIGKLGIVPELVGPTTINSSLLQIRAQNEILPKYLYYCLLSPYFQSIVQSKLEGATTPHLYQREIKNFPVFLAPLDEQKRIVAVLDAAFVGLTRARAHAEANLQNARELFESFAADVVSNCEATFKAKSMSEIAQNLDRQRVPITKSKRVPGDVPYYGASGVVDHVKEYLFDEELLLVSEDGANLLARTYPIAFSISSKTWVNNHAHVLRFENDGEQEFVSLYINSISIEPYVSGMAQPKLNQQSLNRIPVPMPDTEECERIVEKADALRAETNALETNYQSKLTDLDDLRQSLLQKAFAGELT